MSASGTPFLGSIYHLCGGGGGGPNPSPWWGS